MPLAAQRRQEYENIYAAGLQNPQKEKETLEIKDMSLMLKELPNEDGKMEDFEHSKI